VRQPADLIKKKVNEDLSLDKPLLVIYKISKLAYRILVILIANERVKKKDHDDWDWINIFTRMCKDTIE
jgi:hypothetical protein